MSTVSLCVALIFSIASYVSFSFSEFVFTHQHTKGIKTVTTALKQLSTKTAINPPERLVWFEEPEPAEILVSFEESAEVALSFEKMPVKVAATVFPTTVVHNSST